MARTNETELERGYVLVISVYLVRLVNGLM